jgi:N-acetylmuramoyl-L-alanine amidase
MRTTEREMKSVLTLCLLVISVPSIARAQRGSERPTSLTRAQIEEAERRLSELGYWTGVVDGIFDPATRSALVTFQKWEGRSLTGRLTPAELLAIRNSAPPIARESGYAHVEVDVDRQVMLIVNDDGSVRILQVSTGSGKEFIADGQTSVAYTPRGRFMVYDKVAGWEKGASRSMYYSNYISGGVAIHGYASVPNEPASHGCIRIPIFAAAEVSRLLKLGTIVLVYDKVSFVSGREWAENPKLKEAALANIAMTDDWYEIAGTKNRIRKKRPRMIRA